MAIDVLELSSNSRGTLKLDIFQESRFSISFVTCVQIKIMCLQGVLLVGYVYYLLGIATSVAAFATHLLEKDGFYFQKELLVKQPKVTK